MNLREIFLASEKKYAANSIEVNEYKYWVYNRFFIYSEFEKKVNGYGSAYESLPTNKKIICYLKRITSICRHAINRRYLWHKYKNQEVIIVKCHPRRKLIDGKYVSIYTDLLLNEVENVVTYEETDYYTHNKPCYTNDIVYVDSVDITGIANYFLDKYLFKNRIRKLEDQIKETLFPILDDISAQCQVSINYDVILSKILKLYYLSKCSADYWKKEFKKHKVRGVVTVAHYSHYCFGLTKVAHEQGVPVIELQHGTIIKSHIAYQYADGYASNYLPDYIYTFSDFWDKEISVNELGIQVVPIGFEYFNKQKVKSLIETNCPNKNIILILSAKNISERLRKIALGIASEIKDKKYDLRLVYKLHPYEFHSAEVEYKELYENDNITVVKDDPELYTLFSQSVIQIGNNSTALFEGMGFGIQTYFIESQDELLNRMVDENLASFISESSDFSSLLDNIQDNSKSDIDSSKLWKEDAKNNFVCEMEKVFGGVKNEEQ